MATIPKCPETLASASRAQLIEWYWAAHPRFQFFKGLGEGAHLLDVGAGSGGFLTGDSTCCPIAPISGSRASTWPSPETARLYERFHVGNLDEGIPFADGSFDAGLASHLLEHVSSPERVVSEIGRCVRVGGLVYIEMPTPASKELPRAEEFRAQGWPMMISNFFDDGRIAILSTLRYSRTWRDTRSCAAVIGERFVPPYLEDALILARLRVDRFELLLYGYWSSDAVGPICDLREDAVLKVSGAGVARVLAGWKTSTRANPLFGPRT